MTESFQLLRTNVLLTSNYKIVFSSDSKIYLESFNTNKQLSDVKFKKFLVDFKSKLPNELKDFYDGLPSAIAFDVKDDGDLNTMYDDVRYQFDDTYFAGCKTVEDKRYNEAYEYFAPLHVSRYHLPKGFLILRVDGDGILQNEEGEEVPLTKENFRSQIIDQFKCVKYYDLSVETNQGFFMVNNITDRGFPFTTLDFNFSSAGFLSYTGIDYLNGSWKIESTFIRDYLKYEHPFFRMEEYITDGYRENGVIYPYLWNMKFLFNDKKYTFEDETKYSINRYYGFYIDEIKTQQRLFSYFPLYQFKQNYNGKDIQLINNDFVIFDRTEIENGIETDIYIDVDPISGNWNTANEHLYYAYLQNNNGDYDYFKLKRIKKEDGTYKYKALSSEILESIENVYEQIKMGKGTLKIEYRQGADGEFRNYLLLYNWNDSEYNIHVVTDIEKTINQEDFTPIIDIYDSNDNIIEREDYFGSLKTPFSGPIKGVYFEDLASFDINVLRINERIFSIQQDPNGTIYINSDGRFNFDPDKWTYIVNQSGIVQNQEEIERIREAVSSLRMRLSSSSDEEYDSILKSIQYLNNRIKKLNDQIESWRMVSRINDLGNNKPPEVFEVLSYSLLDIRDFDFTRKTTKYTEYEYLSEDKPDDYSYLSSFFLSDWTTDRKPRPIRIEPDIEPRLANLKVNGNIVDLTKDLNINLAIPSSSEYSSSEEAFEIRNDYLTRLWAKNQSVCKWGWNESIHNVDYPYRLNTSRHVNERNNGPDTYLTGPRTYLNNLEHCYYNYDQISNFQLESKKTTHHIPTKFNLFSKPIMNDSGEVVDYEDGYLFSNFDYFSHIFEDKYEFDDFSESRDYLENQRKYSKIGIYQTGIPNRTLFKNCLYEIIKTVGYDKSSDNFIENIEGTNFYNTQDEDITGYKFSVLFTIDTLDEIIEDNIPSDILNNDGNLNALISRPSFSLPPIPYGYENKVDYDIFLNHKYKNILILIRTYKHPVEDAEDNVLNIPEKSNLQVENSLLYRWYEYFSINSNSLQQEIFDAENNTYTWVDSAGNTRPGPYYIQNNERIEFENDWVPLVYPSKLSDIENLTTANYVDNINTRGYYLNKNSDLRYWEISKDFKWGESGHIKVFSKRWDFRGYKLINDKNINHKFNPKELSSPIPDINKYEPLSESENIPFFVDIFRPNIYDINLNAYNIDSNDALFNLQLFAENTLVPAVRRGTAGPLDINYYYGDVLGREINPRFYKDIKVNGNTNLANDPNYVEYTRYSGSYFPIFYNVDIFKKDNLNNSKENPYNKNNKFDTSLTNFGMIKELPRHKINPSGNILKASGSNSNSIYPRIDEFGISLKDRFIFKSNWDIEFYENYNLKT